MFNSLIINVAVGLIFTFGVFALLTSTLTEAIARYLGLRGDFLLRGLRALVDGKSVKAASPAARADVPVPPGQDPPEPTSARLLSTMLLANQGQESILQNTMDGIKGLAARRRLPSYLPARSFSAAVLDLLIPNNATGTTNLAMLVASINQLPAGPFRGSLVALAKDASDDVDRFRSNIEHWYDDHMDRVSGWYKRHIRWISIAIGTLLVLSLNVNAISITRTLYTDQALNESIVTQAVAHTQCDPKPATASPTPRSRLPTSAVTDSHSDGVSSRNAKPRLRTASGRPSMASRTLTTTAAPTSGTSSPSSPAGSSRPWP